ncbi:MAG: hypothetical protein JSU86_17700 [Phycisphaerales bacterium]|nr:MAG: hypothetical protein JSU86_17700 [Phycisphaerales bacterium]
MVTADGTAIISLGKRRRGRTRQWQRRQIREMSRRLVQSGEIPEAPCLLCGAEENPTIHHLEPMRPGDFVFLCESCHKRAHTPLYRTIRVPVASGQFSIRPEAVARQKALSRD